MQTLLARLFLVCGLLLAPLSAAEAAERNCDSNAMIYCGAYSKDELIRKMTQGDSQHTSQNIRALFNAYNIMPRDIRSQNTVNGEVHKDGTVWAGGKKVATGAYSYGRQNIAGSTKQGSLYKRPTSVSFTNGSQAAYVHVQNGRFKWAIIKSCGNLVTATPLAPPAKVDKPTAAPVIQQTVVQQVVQQTVVQKVVQTPPAKPQTAPAPQSNPAPLPQTGAEQAAVPGLAALLGISGGLGLYIRSRDQIRERLLDIA